MNLRCPACSGAHFHELIDFGRLPVSGNFLSYPEQPVPTRHLRFEFCGACGLIRQSPAANTVADYTHVSRPTARQLPEYAAEIIARLRATISKTDDLVVEVGANDGTFLSMLARSGFDNRLGIEPSRSLSNLCEMSGHAVAAIHLDAQAATTLRSQRGAATAVICRHTLEHVPDPVALLCAIALMLDERGTLFLEVPDSAPVLDELRAFELWDEHLFYFSTSNLCRILNASGFEVDHVNVVAHRNSRNIVCWARKSDQAQSKAQQQVATALLQRLREFGARWASYCQELLRQAQQWSPPVIAMGASHPQSNFLHFGGIGPFVSGLIDEDPEKIGRWVALPQPVPVFHPQEIEWRLGRGTLLLTAFGYDSWTQTMRTHFSGRGVSLIVPFDESRVTASCRASKNLVTQTLERGAVRR